MAVISNPALRRFLCIGHFKDLYRAWQEQSAEELKTDLSSIAVMFAVVVSFLPSMTYFLKQYIYSIDLSTVAVGISACLAVVFRVDSGISLVGGENIRRKLRLTHTAFALGCIPLAVILVFSPIGLHNAVRHTVELRRGIVPPVSVSETILFIVKVSVWAGLTEELIFRGMLISAVRRWNGFRTQRQRDIFAVLLSSVIFGFSHFLLWGPVMAVVIWGIGMGFGVAYIATGEYLLALIVYHIAFDFLSLSFSVFL